MSPGAPRGNKNALKHGHYTAEAIANRRKIATLLRKMNTAPSPSMAGIGIPTCNAVRTHLATRAAADCSDRSLGPSLLTAPRCRPPRSMTGVRCGR